MEMAKGNVNAKMVFSFLRPNWFAIVKKNITEKCWNTYRLEKYADPLQIMSEISPENSCFIYEDCQGIAVLRMWFL